MHISKMDLKVLAADMLIKPIHYASRFYAQWRGKFYGLRHHYYLMRFFRWFGRQYLVDVQYPNPLRSEKVLHLHLDICQNTQQWLYRSRGFYELEWIKAINQGLDAADCFLDIGAHIGIFALTLGQARPEKEVIAFEPLPANYHVLRKNIEGNNLDNIRSILGVVSTLSGETLFYTNPINEGGGSLIPMEKYATGGIAIDAEAFQAKHPDFVPCQKVMSYRLDDFITKKSVLKLDTEGSELSILESGERSFQNGLVHQVIVEVGGKTAGAILDWFKAHQFDCFLLGGPKPIQRAEELGPWVGSMGRMLVCIRR